ncbi:MAG: BREX-3 system phosphatase PglZ [Candidatus Cloacimonadaceae bacterium]|nr:BREX-3 system phosphatase PglZ [Candidatus Cloacimonadota bacterium]
MNREQDLKYGELLDAIIERLCASSSQMVILFDHDGLATTTAVFERMVGNGYDIYDYTDNLSLFFYLESKWLKGGKDLDSKLLVMISADQAANAKLPYSVLVNADVIKLRLEDFFEGISTKAVKELPSQYYDLLFELLRSQPQSLTSYKESIDFITRRVFGIDIAGITSEVQFWVVLFKLHYTDTELPGFVVDRLHDSGSGFVNNYEIDLEQALRSSEYFFAFLQREWVHFVKQRVSNVQSAKVLPFDHPDLKVYTDNFFAEGMLKRIRIDNAKAEELGWISCGIDLNESGPADQIESLISTLQAHLPDIDCSYKAWQKYAKDYAEFLHQIFSSDNALDADRVHSLRVEINARFQNWIQQHYDSLSSLPSSKPVMVHQIAKSLAYRRAELNAAKTALIVMDGMSYDQWLCIKTELDLKTYETSEDTLFAWIPTLTSISRQSIFNASVPYYFAQHIGSTVKEPNHWKRYWEDNGVTSKSIHYLRMDGTGDIGAELEKQVNLPSALVIGLVLNLIDDIMHGMNLGSAGMHSQIKHWVKQGYFDSLLQLLIDHGYTVWIISDHGNLECEGIGNIQDGSLSETKASRVRIYQSEALRDQAARKTDTSLAWTPKGLPNDLYCLFAPYRGCYHTVGKKIVSHGGISLEEVMVPFVKINRKSK